MSAPPPNSARQRLSCAATSFVNTRAATATIPFIQRTIIRCISFRSSRTSPATPPRTATHLHRNMLRAHKNKQSRDTGQTVGGFRRILLRQRRYPSYMAIRSQSTIAFFRSRPQRYPPPPPSPHTTRWHGTATANLFAAMANATCRTAPGHPTAAATSA